MKYTNEQLIFSKNLDDLLKKKNKYFFYGIKSNFFKKKKFFFLKLAQKIFGHNKKNFISTRFLGKIYIPFFSYGNITSVNLWDLEDIFLFAYYKRNKNIYSSAYDLGANIGLHSIIFSKIGYKKIYAYEPDPLHIKQMRLNFKINKISNVKVFKKAIYNKKGIYLFNRILGNTQSSHINRAKSNPYGKIKKFKVKTVTFSSILPKSGMSLFKIDIENVEGKSINNTKASDWNFFDAFIEVGDKKNAKMIFCHAEKIKLNIFAHKIKWKKISSFKEMPTNYKEGLIFITKKTQIQF